MASMAEAQANANANTGMPVERRKDRTAIHISDVRVFKDCRQRWDFSSPLRMNLESKNPNKNLLTGSLVHEALAKAYEPPPRNTSDFREQLPVFNAGALVSSYDTAAQARIDEIQASTLSEELKEKIVKEIYLGQGVVRHYALWAPGYEADQRKEHPQLSIREVHATELRVELPLILPGYYLYYEGTVDGLVTLHNGEAAILEHKTAAKFPDPDTLYIDEQMLGYIWGVSADPRVPDDLKPTAVLYNFLLKKVPTPPDFLLNGRLSERKSASMSFEYYKAAVLEAGQDPRDYQSHLYWLYQQGNPFFQRVHITKRAPAIAAFGRRLMDTISDMLDPGIHIYPSPSWFKCSWCPFLEPCQLLQDGINPAPVLQFAYQKREPRWTDRSLEEE